MAPMAAVHMLSAMPYWGHTTALAEKDFMEMERRARMWMNAALPKSKFAHNIPIALTPKARTTVIAGKVIRVI